MQQCGTEQVEMNALDLRVNSSQCSPDLSLHDITKSVQPQTMSDMTLPESVRHHLSSAVECPFICRTCNKSFAQASVLYNHERIHTAEALSGEMYYERFSDTNEGNYSNAPNKKCLFIDEVDAADLHIHRVCVNDKEPFVCEMCDKVFSDRSMLQKHHCDHAGEKRPFAFVTDKKVCDLDGVNSHKLPPADAPPHSCGKCDKTFPDTVQLQTHELIHIGIRPFMCNTCNKRFTQAGHLRRHELTHTGNCPFVCKTCDLRFTRAENLQKHELKHDRDRPFACETCHQKFKEEVLLRTHELSHVVQRTYVCDTCHKSFTQAGSLRRHERIHSGQHPYICGDCNKRFTREENLTRHMFLHTGERPFVCPTCNATFSQSGTLQRHERRHCGERTFDCKKCGKKCYGLSALRAHQYGHTREENLRGISVRRDKISDERDRTKSGSQYPYLMNNTQGLLSERGFQYPGLLFTEGQMSENGFQYSDVYTEGQMSDLIRSEYEYQSNNYRGQMYEDRFDEEEEEHKFGCGICGEIFFTRPQAKSCFYQHILSASDTSAAQDEERMGLVAQPE